MIQTHRPGHIMSKKPSPKRIGRQLEAELRRDERRGRSIRTLIGVLDDATKTPSDLAARHDAYLYALANRTKRRGSR